ncbi:LCP family protein [Candidatus Margulisiibacteriota bacterium]
MKRKKIDFLRILTLMLLIGGIAYFHIFIFFPHMLPYYLRFIPMPRNMNILVMGTDLVFDKETHTIISDLGHTDTIIVVNINTFSNQINLLSIPRDTLVDIPNYGWQKINLAHFLGGPKVAKETVERFLSVPIHRYVVINPKSIINLVDLMGGIRVYVDTDMYYVDKWGGLYINLKKGWQNLSGEQVHGFLRYRLGPSGDIGRVQRQQKFMKTFLRALTSPEMIARAPWVLGIARESVITDLSLKEMTYFLNYTRFLSIKDVNMTLLPGRFAIGEYNTSIWLADMDTTEELVGKYFSRKKNHKTKGTKAPSSAISIINTTNEFGPVKEIMRLIADKNYAIINITDESRADIAKTKVIAQKGDAKGARTLARQIGIEEVEVSSTGNIWSDFTIVVCDDWKEKYLNKISK